MPNVADDVDLLHRPPRWSHGSAASADSEPAGHVAGTPRAAPGDTYRFMASLSLLEKHGIELLAMARFITGSIDIARSVVSEVLITAGARTTTTRTGAETSIDANTQATLVRATYRSCCMVLSDPDHETQPFNQAIAWLSRTCDRQRVVVALFVHGGQTPAQIGPLLGLSTPAVWALLLPAIDDLTHAPLP